MKQVIVEQHREYVKKNNIFREELVSYEIVIDGCCSLYFLPTTTHAGGIDCEEYFPITGCIIAGECQCCKHFNEIN